MSIFRRRPKLCPHEEAILDAVVAAAPTSIADTLRAQVRQIGYVQRNSGSAEITFYAKRRRGGGWDERSLFPNRSEVHLGEFSAVIDRHRHEGSVFCVAGHIFALTLRPAVKTAPNSVVTELTVHLNDPSRLLQSASASPPLEIAPDSYLRGSEPDGDPAPVGWSIVPKAESYVVSLPDADWSVVAQGPGTHLLLGRKGTRGDAFCLVDIEGDVITHLASTSWNEALREAVTGAA